MRTDPPRSSSDATSASGGRPTTEGQQQRDSGVGAVEEKQKGQKRAFMSVESRFTGRYSREVFETLKFAYSKHLFKIALLLILGFCGRFLLLSNANIIGHWVDTFCRAPVICRPVPALYAGLSNGQFLAVLMVVTVVGFFKALSFRISMSRTSAQAVSLLYDEVTVRTSRLPIRFFDTTPTGAIVTRFSSDYGNVFRLFGGPLAEFCVIIFDLVSMVILVSLASIWYLPIVLIIGAMNWGLFVLNREKLRTERRELSASRAPAIAHFAETAQGASTIRVFSRQTSFLQRFRFLNENYLRRRLSTFAAVYRFSFQMALLSGLLLLFTGFAGYWLVRWGHVSVGSIGVAFTFIALSAASMQMFFDWLTQFEEAMTGVERLDHYLRMDTEPGACLPSTALFPTAHPRYRSEETAEAGPSFGEHENAEIRTEGLWFRYRPDAPWILKDINFTVAPGERLGIVGRTGSGKSSLIQALFHLYPIERGHILIDGHFPQKDTRRPPLVGEVDLERYRRAITFIAQEPTLFRGTLRENLSLDLVQSEENLWRVLDRVDLRLWAESHALGLDLAIEERGRNLSLGERQLVCMARCLMQESPIVVMDEATSAIDPQSEEILVRATEEFFKNRTQLIIAHRLSTLESCDRILWLEAGTDKRLGATTDILRDLRESRSSVT